MAQAKRKDKARTVLKKGEGQRNNGTYYYRWQDKKETGTICTPRHYRSFANRKSRSKKISMTGSKLRHGILR